MFAFEKFGMEEQVKTIEKEREFQADMWKYILKNQVAPVRWSMKMWTRFNIAESQVHKTSGHFRHNWDVISEQLDRLRPEELATALEWKSYAEEKERQHEIVKAWLGAFDKWVESCYPAPADRTINTSDTICHHGIDYNTFRQGLLDSEAMWHNFALPLLKQYQKSQHYDEDVHSEVFRHVKDAIFREGDYHSFKCEFKWFLNRVRYFELIPNWEINRVADDAEKYFKEITDFRTKMIEDFGVEATGVYAIEHVKEMEKKKDLIVDFLTRWEKADPSVYDADREKHRRTIRGSTGDLSKDAMDVYNWYFAMAYAQFKWKEGKPQDYVSTNYLWSDPAARYVRPIVMKDSREGWRSNV